MEILTFILCVILVGVLVAILIWGGVTDWKFSSKMYSCKKNTSGKYICEIDINGKQTLEDCQKSCAPNKKITCPQGARKICNANDPHCIDNSSKYC